MQRDNERGHRHTRLLSAAEAAEMLRLSRLHVQTLAVSRELPGIWLENTLLFHRGELPADAPGGNAGSRLTREGRRPFPRQTEDSRETPPPYSHQGCP
jgi:hypothetical protein